jgi:hypothetical protein
MPGGGVIRFDFGTSAACLVAGQYQKFRLSDETWRQRIPLENWNSPIRFLHEAGSGFRVILGGLQ